MVRVLMSLLRMEWLQQLKNGDDNKVRMLIRQAIDNCNNWILTPLPDLSSLDWEKWLTREWAPFDRKYLLLPRNHSIIKRKDYGKCSQALCLGGSLFLVSFRICFFAWIVRTPAQQSHEG